MPLLPNDLFIIYLHHLYFMNNSRAYHIILSRPIISMEIPETRKRRDGVVNSERTRAIMSANRIPTTRRESIRTCIAALPRVCLTTPSGKWQANPAWFRRSGLGRTSAPFVKHNHESRSEARFGFRRRLPCDAAWRWLQLKKQLRLKNSGQFSKCCV